MKNKIKILLVRYKLALKKLVDDDYCYYYYYYYYLNWIQF